MSDPRFVHLRVHSDFSMSDGVAKVKPILAQVEAKGMAAVALTDQNNLCGLVKFYGGCHGAGIKPIIGIHTARPGVVIGKKGEDVEVLRAAVSKLAGTPAQINIAEIRKPELDAKLVADSIAQQLERRVMFRRAMKRAVQNAMRIGAQGIKVEVSGRLGGAEIARSEWYREGRVPLHTLRADIDYSTSESHTQYGVIGIKVWIFKGEVLDGMLPQIEEPKQQQPKRKPRGK